MGARDKEDGDLAGGLGACFANIEFARCATDIHQYALGPSTTFAQFARLGWIKDHLLHDWGICPGSQVWHG